MPQYELNLRDYWQIIQKRRLVLVVIFFAAIVFTIIYTNLQKPIYRAVTSVRWVERKPFASLLVELASVPVGKGDPLITQSRIITSQPILKQVVKKLGLVAEHASEDEIREQVAVLQGAVSTSVDTEANIIRIVVTYGDPKMAAQIANKTAEVYMAENVEENSMQSRRVREFIEKRIANLIPRLEKSEQALARFREKETPSGLGLVLQNKLADLEEKLRNLLQKYTENHPDVVNIREEIVQAKDRLKTLPKKELGYSRLDRDVQINANLYRQLKERLEAARITETDTGKDVRLINEAAPPLRPISPNKPLNYSFGAMIGLMLGLAVAFLFEQLDTSIGTIEDVENYLKLPVLGIIPYLKTKDDKKTGLAQRLWPRELKGKEKHSLLRNQLLIHYSNSSPTFEAYRTLRINIETEIFKEKIQRKIILCSSSGPEEGKSITTSNLAIAMAQGGLRTLLIDADLRRAVIHHIFGMKNEPGLSNVLSGTIDSKDAIRTFADILTGEVGFDEALNIPGLDNLNILVSGSLPVGPAELLASPEMASLLTKSRGIYDVILIDSPPVLAVADAIILASKVDAVILVYRVGKTARALLNRTKIQLVQSGAQVKGVILNNISPQIEMRYGYHYHYKYYGKYYNSEEKAKKKV
ncbi:MAG: polysaccharide biosynthesis tyrosine autokinase [Candidatus Omnitrophota bacterium]|nr:polysaccharide biosynthesis tyrosine autokinase [Candidatus Omnitrophota bacterium]